MLQTLAHRPERINTRTLSAVEGPCSTRKTYLVVSVKPFDCAQGAGMALHCSNAASLNEYKQTENEDINRKLAANKKRGQLQIKSSPYLTAYEI